MDRGTYKRICISDQLSHFHLVALLYERLAWCSDMLRHRNTDSFRYSHYFSGTSSSMLFVTYFNAVQVLTLLSHFQNLPFLPAIVKNLALMARVSAGHTANQ